MLSDAELQEMKTLIDCGNLASLRELLQPLAAEDIEAGQLFSDQTIFMYACQHGTPEIVQCFWDKGLAFYEVKYSDSTEFKCAARNASHAAGVLAVLLAGMSKDWAQELLQSNGDPWGGMDGGGDGQSAIDILLARNDTEALQVVAPFRP